MLLTGPARVLLVAARGGACAVHQVATCGPRSAAPWYAWIVVLVPEWYADGRRLAVAAPRLGFGRGALGSWDMGLLLENVTKREVVTPLPWVRTRPPGRL